MLTMEKRFTCDWNPWFRRQHHAPVRVLPQVTKLDDCFGDFLVRVTCPCGASRQIERSSRADRGALGDVRRPGRADAVLPVRKKGRRRGGEAEAARRAEESALTKG
jgi:hypothetical protein